MAESTIVYLCKCREFTTVLTFTDGPENCHTVTSRGDYARQKRVWRTVLERVEPFLPGSFGWADIYSDRTVDDLESYPADILNGSYLRAFPICRDSLGRCTRSFEGTGFL